MNELLIKIHTSIDDMPSVGQVGGKALPLLELSKRKIPIPRGFVVTTRAHDLFLHENGLAEKMKNIFTSPNKDVRREIIRVREEIQSGVMPQELAREIDAHIEELGIKHYAVRSSATAEDAKNRSWAGEFESYLNISPQDIGASIRKCWASMLSDRVIDYAGNFSEISSMKMAVIIQESIDSDISGVCFTRNPLDAKDGSILIESVFGLGEALVQGEVTPDRYTVERGTGIILEIIVGDQTIAYKADKNIGIKLVPLKKTFKQKLSGKEILQLATLALKVEKIQGSGRDIEWCKKDGVLFILQSRPITTGR